MSSRVTVAPACIPSTATIWSDEYLLEPVTLMEARRAEPDCVCAAGFDCAVQRMAKRPMRISDSAERRTAVTTLFRKAKSRSIADDLLLHGDRLCEITRLVHIAASANGNVVREHLQRHNFKYRRN